LIGYIERCSDGFVAARTAALDPLWLMAFSAAILVFTPTYAQIGIFAPILMTAARLLQGFAIGGEMGPASAMLLEYADERSRGLYTSWQPFSQGIAAVFAALVALSRNRNVPFVQLLRRNRGWSLRQTSRAAGEAAGGSSPSWKSRSGRRNIAVPTREWSPLRFPQ
jgi:MFS family permease